MLNGKQLADFERDGFLVIENVIDEATRQALQQEYASLVDQVASDRHQQSADWASLSFEQRFTHLIAHDPDAYEHLDISLPMIDGMNHQSGVHTGAAVFALLTHPRLLDVVESIVGAEIVSNPVQHARIKPPESALNAAGRGNSNLARTGWHQDAAVIVESAEHVPILTAWVAITDATPQMGCMQAVAGSHRWQGLGLHCPGKSGLGEIYIPPGLVGDHTLTHLSVKAGGVVLLHKNTWHGAGPNQSDRMRWSFDLRYQPPGHPTGRSCFPEFLARSQATPDNVLTSAAQWQALWHRTRDDIAEGRVQAVFNERWQVNRTDPLCA